MWEAKYILVFTMVCCLCLYFGIIAISFTDIYNNNLQTMVNERKKDTWLLEKCQDEDFRFHMRNHEELCNNVEQSAQRNIRLAALHHTAKELDWCGSYSCERVLIATLDRLQFSLYTWVFLLILMLLFVAVLGKLCTMWEKQQARNKISGRPVGLLQVATEDDSQLRVYGPRYPAIGWSSTVGCPGNSVGNHWTDVSGRPTTSALLKNCAIEHSGLRSRHPMHLA